MLIGWSKDRHGPGPHTGRVIVTADGTRWTIGDRDMEGGGTFSSWVSYHVTCDAKWFRAADGKRRKVRPDCKATWHSDCDEYDRWTIDTFDGDWRCSAVEST